MEQVADEGVAPDALAAEVREHHASRQAAGARDLVAVGVELHEDVGAFMNQSRCMTALVIASRRAFIGYSGMFSRHKASMRQAVRVLRSMKRMASSMSATIPPSKSLRSRTCTLSVPLAKRQVM